MKLPEAFYTLHSDLDREGPGEAADVVWAVDQAGVVQGARILDAGAGPGGDIETLLAAVPGAHVTAIDQNPDFVERIASQHSSDRVIAIQGDMLEAEGPFDFIWSAGAVYNVGVRNALEHWCPLLAKGGHVAFSEICWYSDPPEEAAAYWAADYPAMTDEAGIAAHVRDAGFETVATRRVSDAAWEAYYAPLDTRIARLRDGADAAMTAVLDDAEAEAALWRKYRKNFGYLLSVVRPA